MANELAVDGRYVVYKIEDRIMVIAYKRGVSIDLHAATQIVTERLKVYDGAEYPTLVDIRQAKLFNKPARDYFAVDGVIGMTALAIVTGNHFTAITANLFMRFSKPRVPTSAFKTKEQALRWLYKFLT